MTLIFVMAIAIAVAIVILATLILKVRKTMINCKTCRNTKNCVYAGADREMEECVDRIPTTNFVAIRSMTEKEMARQIASFTGYEGNPEEVAFWLNWLREEVEA